MALAFYNWTVKNLKTGKSVTWSSKKALKNNSWIEGPEFGAGGTQYPIAMGEFKKAGKYKITVKIFHGDKVAAKVSKTVTVK